MFMDLRYVSDVEMAFNKILAYIKGECSSSYLILSYNRKICALIIYRSPGSKWIIYKQAAANSLSKKKKKEH